MQTRKERYGSKWEGTGREGKADWNIMIGEPEFRAK